MSEIPKPAANAKPAPGRPQMPLGYGNSADDTHFVSWEHVTEQMTNSRNYWVATTRPDGRPHLMPVWGIWLDETFYFGTDSQSRKGRNLAANPAIVVHLESGDDVVIVEGTADRLADPALFNRYADAYEAKYQFRPSNSDDNTTYILKPRVVFAWSESDFVNDRTRWLFD